MKLPGRTRLGRTASILAVLLASAAAAAQQPEPILYTVRIAAPETGIARVEARIPTGSSATVDLMMAVWSPGYYVREDYARRVQSVTALSTGGDTLTLEQPQPNRWRVHTGGEASITLTYELQCTQRSVTGNSVSPDIAVLNGAPTFITLADLAPRPHDVRLELPDGWNHSATSLAAAPDGRPGHYRATSYDELVDSPIVMGNLAFHEFDVGGAQHILADAGDVPSAWDGALAAQNLERIARATERFWGSLPFRKYVFLNVFRQGGGGLEHLNSTLLTSSPRSEGGGNLRWLAFVAHEYFHALNVKRLRPVELGPFDYEQPPTTASLWIAEGLTSYYGNLLVSRAGLGTEQDLLASLSSSIASLQTGPGRLVQTLEQASLGIFATGGSGVGGDRNTTVSYYVKGTVVGWLLDARIQHATGGTRSLDDVMRLANRRYSGPRGYTPAQFEAAASEVAGTDLTPLFHTALRTTEELDYSEALDWFGLRFGASGDPAAAWTLEVRPDATPAQRERVRRWAVDPAPWQRP
jgi:predicted metalloprotease with PDZ domain